MASTPRRMQGFERGLLAVVAFQQSGQGRQKHQGQDHRQILDDQPPHGDAAAVGVQKPAFLQRA